MSAQPLAGQMIVIDTHGNMLQTECKAPPSLEEVQAAVGGYVELVGDIVHGDQQVQIYCNEEGKLENLPLNQRATGLVMHMVPGFSDYFAGPVVLLVGAACWRADANH